MRSINVPLLLQFFIQAAPGIFLFVVAALGAYYELNSFKWDWDLDHWMYFGGRIVEGERIWTVEFEDKLPVVQLLFYIPAKLHSVRVWQWMSIISIISSCCFVYVFIINLIRDNLGNISKSTAKLFAFYVIAIMASSYVIAPGGISQIEGAASSLAIIAIISLYGARKIQSKFFITKGMIFLFAAFIASLAIGIRPYYFFPIILASLWLSLRTSLGSKNIQVSVFKDIFFSNIQWIFWIGIFGLSMNALPYFLSGQEDVFISGLTLLSEDINPKTVFQAIKKLIFGFGLASELFALFMVISIAFAILVPLYLGIFDRKLITANLFMDIIYLVILCPVLTISMILSKHFWPHYFQLFIPFIAISIIFMVAILFSIGKLNFNTSQKKIIYIVLLAVLFVSGKRYLMHISWLYIAPPEVHQLDIYLNVLNKYRLTKPEGQRDFLNPSRMYLHWQLKESRYGFPHSAISNRIFNGIWEDVKIPHEFDIPTTRTAYCAMLEDKGPHIVVEVGAEGLTKCFTENQNSNYRRITSLSSDIEIDPSKLWLFERISD